MVKQSKTKKNTNPGQTKKLQEENAMKLNELGSLGCMIGLQETNTAIKVKVVMDIIVAKGLVTASRLDYEVAKEWKNALAEIEEQYSNQMEEKYGDSWKSLVRAQIKQNQQVQKRAESPIWLPGMQKPPGMP